MSSNRPGPNPFEVCEDTNTLHIDSSQMPESLTLIEVFHLLQHLQDAWIILGRNTRHNPKP